MTKYLILCNLKHEKNTINGNTDVHLHTVEANSFGEAELKIKTQWAKYQVDCTIIQITIYN